MKLFSISIKNFRSIFNSTISGPSDDVWTFIGQNNAGKSSVIYAIRAFYGEYDVTAEDFYRESLTQDSIELIFEYQLNDDEFSQLPEFYKLPGNKLKVVKRFARNNLKGESHGFEFKNGEEVERQEDFFGARNVQVGKLGNIIYIPAVKDLAEELKKSKSSIFTKLISRIISETLTTLPSWSELVKKAHAFSQDLRSPIKDSGQGNLNSVHEIEENLTKMLSSWRLRSQIVVSPPTPEDIVLTGSRLRFISEETGHEEDPLILGSGAQRSIVNSLLLLWARIESKKVKTDKKKFNGELTLLLYEEPEALLHYDQERKLLKDLEEIASSENTQVILCTHSPNLISTKSNTLESISRFIKVGNVTNIFRASQDFLDRLKQEKHVFDFVLWLNPDRNTMFFVDKVILVEGSADKALFNYLIHTENLEENVYVIDCGGKSNIPRFMSLCSEFAIKHNVVFDRDGDETENHKKWNNNIENNKTKHTCKIKAFPVTIAEYIKFSVENRDKPVEILEQLRTGKLSTEKKLEFIDFVKD